MAIFHNKSLLTFIIMFGRLTNGRNFLQKVAVPLHFPSPPHPFLLLHSYPFRSSALSRATGVWRCLSWPGGSGTEPRPPEFLDKRICYCCQRLLFSGFIAKRQCHDRVSGWGAGPGPRRPNSRRPPTKPFIFYFSLMIDAYETTT